MTRRRWIADSWNDVTAALHGEQAKHLSRVLRAQPGMEFDVVAGGRAWHARIASIDRESVQFTLLRELETAPALPVTLLLSIFKFDRMEWAIEKAVELGCSRIVPIVAERTEKHLALAAGKRGERWRRIALEAAKQSRRGDLPAIAEPPRLAAIHTISQPTGGPQPATAGEKNSPLPVLLSETDEDQPLLRILETTPDETTPDASDGIMLAVGPEGGWTAAEIDFFTQAGGPSGQPGAPILRVGT